MTKYDQTDPVSVVIRTDHPGNPRLLQHVFESFATNPGVRCSVKGKSSIFALVTPEAREKLRFDARIGKIRTLPCLAA